MATEQPAPVVLVGSRGTVKHVAVWVQGLPGYVPLCGTPGRDREVVYYDDHSQIRWCRRCGHEVQTLAATVTPPR